VDYMTLVGAEAVQSAGHNIADAARRMEQAAATMQDAAQRIERALREHAEAMHAIFDLEKK